MELCSDDHDEVCYEDTDCPVCRLVADHKDEVTQFENEIRDKNKEISRLESDLDDANNRINNLTGEG